MSLWNPAENLLRPDADFSQLILAKPALFLYN